jgi:YesN/AraC family two-component response regulator
MPYKILLVDDNKGFRDGFRETFEEYDVIEVNNGQEALDLLDKPNEVDMVILDVMMPGLRGTKVLKEIKRISPELPIIILTGYSSKDVAVEALKGHADDYIEKPFNVNKTKEIIRNILKTKEEGADINAVDMKGKIERVRRFAKRNFHKKISLKDAAAVVYLSPKYLSRTFKEYAGMTFSQYKLKIKIDEAKKFLTGTGYNVSEIADKLSYENLESFIRIFKKFTGCTPTEYRGRNRNNKSRSEKRYEKKYKKTKKNI